MISYPASLRSMGGAKNGVAPVNLLDIQDVNGNFYFFSDRPCSAKPANLGVLPYMLSEPDDLAAGEYIAWIKPTVVVTQDGNGGASATLNGGSMVCLGPNLFTPTYMQWSNFDIPVGAIPAGATIVKARFAAFIEWGAGPLISPGSPAKPPGAPFKGMFFGDITGSATPTDIAANVWKFMFWATGGPAFDYSITVTSPTIAVYYTLPPGRGSSYGSGGSAAGIGPYKPWLLSVPEFTFHRSAVTDSGNFVIQNLSGDTLSRDMEKALRASAFEGAFFVYRCYQADAQAPWIEVHGKLTVVPVGVDTVTLKGTAAITPAEDDTPQFQYCETCQWRWSSPQCGATGATECQYSFETCQVPERIFVVLNNFEKNYGEAVANLPTQAINRRRRI